MASSISSNISSSGHVTGGSPRRGPAVERAGEAPLRSPHPRPVREVARTLARAASGRTGRSLAGIEPGGRRRSRPSPALVVPSRTPAPRARHTCERFTVVPLGGSRSPLPPPVRSEGRDGGISSGDPIVPTCSGGRSERLGQRAARRTHNGSSAEWESPPPVSHYASIEEGDGPS